MRHLLTPCLSLSVGLLLCAAPPVRAQQPAAAATPAPVELSGDTSLKQLMTPEEFRAAGLKKLSPEELQHLERFLQGYRDQAVQQSAKVTEERVNPPPKRNRATRQNVIESQINGPFMGLTGRTRVVLANGSVWQQANDNDKFTASLQSPDVVLVRTVFGYKMYVTGAIRWFYVRQVVLE